MQNKIFQEKIVVDGTFGDKEVHISGCVPYSPKGIQIILLHGVHSTANLRPNNKILFFAELLAQKGYSTWMVETSRMVRDRHNYDDDSSAWIKAAFAGKTFCQEQEDDFRAIHYVLKKSDGKPVWIWGFSLGGAIALSAASEEMFHSRNIEFTPEMIILGGIGITPNPKIVESMGNLPILSTVEKSISKSLLAKVKTKSVISFRGEHDEIFSRASCADLLDKIGIPAEQKIYKEIECVDHSFRMNDEIRTRDIANEMVEFVIRHKNEKEYKNKHNRI